MEVCDKEQMKRKLEIEEEEKEEEEEELRVESRENIEEIEFEGEEGDDEDEFETDEQLRQIQELLEVIEVHINEAGSLIENDRERGDGEMGQEFNLSSEEEDDDDFDYEENDDEDEDEDAQETETETAWNDYLKLNYIEAKDLENGCDYQGIPWARIHISRQSHRQKRLEKFEHFHNLPLTREAFEKELIDVDQTGEYYDFKTCSLQEKPAIFHFQLLNLLWATTNCDLYFMKEQSLQHYSPITRKSTKILTSDDYNSSIMTTMAAKDNLIVLGGRDGELVCKYSNQQGVSYSGRLTSCENGITNCLDIIEDLNGNPQIMASNNDQKIRFLDLNLMKQTQAFNFEWPVNYSQLSPDKRLVCAVGDDTTGKILNAITGEVISELKGHQDYSFACIWSPDGRLIATGNQDQTIRLYDIRNVSRSLAVMESKLSTFRSLRFTPDGEYLVGAEDVDFVHIYSTKDNFQKAQVIDFFGDISGITLSPDGDSLFIGNADQILGCIFEFSRKKFCWGDLML